MALGYQVIECVSISDLIDEINEWLNKDWRPLGGPFSYEKKIWTMVFVEDNVTAGTVKTENKEVESTVFCQAITKSF